MRASAKRLQHSLPLLLASVLAVGMFIGQKLPRYDGHLWVKPASYRLSAAKSPIEEVLQYIEARYVDSVNRLRLQEDVIRLLLSRLDPHSIYLSPEELRMEEEMLSGSFEGIGVEFLVLNDTIQVMSVISGGPSERAGILIGDKIVVVGDSTVAGVGITNAEVIRRLRGPKGSTVRLGILRGQENKLRYFTVERDIIPVHSVDAAYMLDEQIGYIKINRFSATTRQEFMEAMERLVKQYNMKHLVLDLRGNPGGYLNEATDLLSQFFPKGKLLVYTEGRAEPRQEYKSHGRTYFNVDGLVVLVDEGSASASEIVAGAVQDHDRGWVVGRRTFGKGLVQAEYPLSNSGALRLTTSRYYTPSGRCIQRAYKNEENYEAEAQRRLHNGELTDSSVHKIADTTRYFTGAGRVVYGGGGIMPDIFIPLDTSFWTDYYLQVLPLLSSFAAHWLKGQDRSTLPTTATEFVSRYSIPADLSHQLADYAASRGIPFNAQQWQKSRRELQRQLKAHIARQLFQQEGYYRVLNDDDPAVEKALQLLRRGAAPGLK
ncbi:MAG: S41 family peptidase [Saprospiraceae bacterium]|nr:S41 family peptidase [Saprospiraceae bacterium]MDW8485089.1 S41 family peptidase [Saprospiraceae bacterium]